MAVFKVTKACPQCGQIFTRAYESQACSPRCAARARWGDSEVRFWSRVDKRGPDECWLWTGSKFWNGYGQFLFRGKNRKTSQVAWMLTNGDIPKGEGFHGTCVCHRCDVRLCCNPAHLFLASHKRNVDDKVEKQRQARGSSHGNAKLIEADVIAIRAAKLPHREIAKTFGISLANVGFIRARIAWKHV